MLDNRELQRNKRKGFTGHVNCLRCDNAGGFFVKNELFLKIFNEKYLTKSFDIKINITIFVM